MAPIRCIPKSPLSSTSAGSNSPLASRVKKSTPDRADQRLGEGVGDQGVGAPARQRAPHRDAGRGGAHAGGQVPGVVVGPCHICYPANVPRRFLVIDAL